MPNKKQARQANMFEESNADLPLFSQTAPPASVEPFVPKPASRQPHLLLSTCEKCTKNSKVKVHHPDVTQPQTLRRRRGAPCLSADNWHLSN